MFKRRKDVTIDVLELNGKEAVFTMNNGIKIKTSIEGMSMEGIVQKYLSGIIQRDGLPT